MPERLTRGLERGREKSKRTWSFSSNRCRNVSPVSRRRNAYTPPRRSTKGTIFGAEKYLWREKVLYLAARPPSPRSLTNFSSIFSSCCFSFRPSRARQPTQEPLSASVNILLPAYTVASRRDGSRLLFTLLWPAHSTRCLAVSLPTVSVHYQHRPGNDHRDIPNPRKISQRILHWRFWPTFDQLSQAVQSFLSLILYVSTYTV